MWLYQRGYRYEQSDRFRHFLTFFKSQASLRIKEPLMTSLDKLITNAKALIWFVISLSNHERNQRIQKFLKQSNSRCTRSSTGGQLPASVCRNRREEGYQGMASPLCM